jgi:hypothetical protein
MEMSWRRVLLAVVVVIQLAAWRRWGDPALYPLWAIGCLWLLWIGGGNKIRLAFRWMRRGALLRCVDGRFRRGECENCGHNLAGQTSGNCPACGENVKQITPTSA